MLVDIRDLRGRRTAPGAVLQVLAQPALRPHPQPAAGVRAEPVRVPGAVALGGQRTAHVRLQIRLLETFACTVGQYGGGVGRQPEQRRDLARRLLLDRGVPQHGLVALRQAAERPYGQGLLGFAHGADVRAEVERVVVQRGAGRRDREHGEILDQLLALRGPSPGGGHPADGGEQIGAYGRVGAGAAAYGLEGTGEDFAGEVVGGVRVPAATARVAPYGVGVAAVQLLVRAVVTAPHAVDQLAIRGERPGLPGRGPCRGRPVRSRRPVRFRRPVRPRRPV